MTVKLKFFGGNTRFNYPKQGENFILYIFYTRGGGGGVHKSLSVKIQIYFNISCSLIMNGGGGVQNLCLDLVNVYTQLPT